VLALVSLAARGDLGKPLVRHTGESSGDGTANNAAITPEIGTSATGKGEGDTRGGGEGKGRTHLNSTAENAGRSLSLGSVGFGQQRGEGEKIGRISSTTSGGLLSERSPEGVEKEEKTWPLDAVGTRFKPQM